MKVSIIKIFMPLCILMFLAQSVWAQEYNWYFKSSGNGKRPVVCPEADFVSKYPVISMAREGEKKLYLTFDAGYENGNVEKILDILRENDVKATFFVLPHIVKNNSSLCKRMKLEGHVVGNHSVHHKNMAKISNKTDFDNEILPLEQIFAQSTGFELDKFFRPPEGAFNEATLRFAELLGYKTVFWSLAYADWDNSRQLDADKALDILLSKTHDGAVVLLHPTSSTNVKILDSYIKNVKTLGYSFDTVDKIQL